jgi:hypothetical protein
MVLLRFLFWIDIDAIVNANNRSLFGSNIGKRDQQKENILSLAWNMREYDSIQ